MVTRKVTGSTLAAMEAAAFDNYQKYSQQATFKDGETSPEVAIPPRYQAIIDEFPGLDKPNFDKKPLVTHSIETTGRPVKAGLRHIGGPGTPRWMKENKHGMD